MADIYDILNQHSTAELLSLLSYNLEKTANKLRASSFYSTGLYNAIAALKDNRPDDALRIAEMYLEKAKKAEKER